jgi:hypothetical protein
MWDECSYVHFHTFHLGVGCKYVVNFAPLPSSRFTARKRKTQYPFNRRLQGSQIRLGGLGIEKNPFPFLDFEPRTLQH